MALDLEATSLEPHKGSILTAPAITLPIIVARLLIQNSAPTTSAIFLI